MPFVTFYTPTYNRPNLLYRCERSVRQQLDQDLQHLIIEDFVGIGIVEMFRQVSWHAARVQGMYVYMLQDDDALLDERVVGDFKEFVGRKWPPVVICKVHIGRREFPPDAVWEQEPQIRKIDMGSYFVRADVWKRHACDFGQRYEGDFDFIYKLWEDGYDFAWWKRVVAFKQAIGKGLPESKVRIFA